MKPTALIPACLLLLAFPLIAQDRDPVQPVPEAERRRAALGEFRSLIGTWRGEGTWRKGSYTEAWTVQEVLGGTHLQAQCKLESEGKTLHEFILYFLHDLEEDRPALHYLDEHSYVHLLGKTKTPSSGVTYEPVIQLTHEHDMLFRLEKKSIDEVRFTVLMRDAPDQEYEARFDTRLARAGAAQEK